MEITRLENQSTYESRLDFCHSQNNEPVPESERAPENGVQSEGETQPTLILDDFTISEIIYNTGTKSFTEVDKNEWKTKSSDEFLSKYIDNPLGDVERTGNVLELYYNGKEFDEGNFKRMYFTEDENYGFVELSRVNLYSKENSSKVGVAQFVCTSNIFNDTGYIMCDTTYFIESELTPQNVKAVTSTLSKFSSINFKDNYISSGTSGSTFWEEGDAFFSMAEYSLENGLNRTTASVNIYLPKNSLEGRRSICINFDTLKSNNFLPQENYGSASNRRLVVKDLVSSEISLQQQKFRD